MDKQMKKMIKEVLTHKCGTQLVKVSEDEVHKNLSQRYWYGDMGQIWKCPKCREYVWCGM